MDIDRLIDNLNTRIGINREMLAEHVNNARTRNDDHNIYTELVDFHKGKIQGYEQAIEMIREEAQ
jgi:hypothetical protein